jgi:hypothetical protein
MSGAREDEPMASRLLTFGIRYREKGLTFGIRYREKGRTVRVRASERDPRRYVVEVGTDRGRKRRREHGSLASAVRDFAASWRGRLH